MADGRIHQGSDAEQVDPGAVEGRVLVERIANSLDSIAESLYAIKGTLEKEGQVDTRLRQIASAVMQSAQHTLAQPGTLDSIVMEVLRRTRRP